MNTHETFRAVCLAALLAAAGAAQAATATDTAPAANSAPGMTGHPETSSARQKMSDSAVTTKVKAELLAAKGLKSTGIHVKTRDGVVSLDGVVPSEDQRTLAAQTARNVDGVASVSNSLQVVTR
ncbi:BON domain-containing protein [Cupriavidus sp. 2TAF22]|uniref:BON domain-containing protein n=1 Tax=unclassified Cupriavidus TaxID=2640874 RepID=UPI003F9300E9